MSLRYGVTRRDDHTVQTRLRWAPCSDQQVVTLGYTPQQRIRYDGWRETESPSTCGRRLRRNCDFPGAFQARDKQRKGASRRWETTTHFHPLENASTSNMAAGVQGAGPRRQSAPASTHAHVTRYVSKLWKKCMICVSLVGVESIHI